MENLLKMAAILNCWAKEEEEDVANSLDFPSIIPQFGNRKINSNYIDLSNLIEDALIRWNFVGFLIFNWENLLQTIWCYKNN